MRIWVLVFLLLGACSQSGSAGSQQGKLESGSPTEPPVTRLPVTPVEPKLEPLTWARGEVIQPGGHPNPYALDEEEFKTVLARGRVHPLHYPVTVTGSILPYRPIKRFLDGKTSNPLSAILHEISSGYSDLDSFREAMDWLGLHRYPKDAGTSPESFPLPPGYKVGDHMGLTRFKTKDGIGFTVSCAGCHVSNLFGRPIFGLTNRFPRANQFFIRGKMLTELAPTPLFQLATEARSGEAKLYRRTRHNMRHVDSKRPETLGLDTSLAHVALSLARRSRDQYATKDPNKPYQPDDEILKTYPADSKPAVWWNVKYKNRFLLDGSVVSGNPIITNILWNEIGRGTDLHELEDWIGKNGEVLKELTTAVYSAKAPHITEFFPAENIDLESAKRGQTLFQAHCARCHGQYEKAWDLANASELSPPAKLKTTLVRYPKNTRVVDVGTDSHRYKGMKSLEALNTLKISKLNGVVIESQKGYVPPPLEGIWARWPYFHNNSVPSLCALLSPERERPSRYWAGHANDPSKDFDFECNGYPTGSKTPSAWKKSREYEFNSKKAGLGNFGHDEGILTVDGKPVFNKDQRTDLIQFLQTL